MESKFTPVSMFTEVSLQDMVENEKGQHKHVKKGKVKNQIYNINILIF